MRKSLNWTGFLISAIVGCLVTITVNKLLTNRSFYFPLKFEIDPFQVISLGVTVWLAYFLKEVLDKKSETRNHLTSLASNRIERVVGELQDFQRSIDDLTLQGTRATSISKKLTAHRKIIEGFIEVDTRFDQSEVSSFKQDYNNHVRAVRDLLTNTPPGQSTGIVDITFSNGLYTYSESRVDLVRQAIVKLESLLVSWQRNLYIRD